MIGPVGRGTIALVESPVQLLHVLEWTHARQTAEDTRIIVLPPTDRISRDQLRAMGEFAEEEGIPVEWYDPRSSAWAGVRTLATLRPSLVASARLVVGDPFSGLIHTMLPVVRARDIVVIDDGTATMEFVNQLAAGVPLTRWDAPPAGRRAMLRRPLVEHARGFFTPGRGRRVDLFTVMPVAQLPGLEVETHCYDWTRRRFGPPRILPGTDLVGTSLVESGVVEAEAYLDGVTELAATPGASGRYFAHRREDPAKLRRLAQRSGLEIVRPTVPLEIELRRGPVGRRVVSFPSSVGYTLPLVLAEVPTAVTVLDVVPAWIRRDVGHSARGFLGHVAEQARRGAVTSAPGGAVTSAPGPVRMRRPRPALG